KERGSFFNARGALPPLAGALRRLFLAAGADSLCSRGPQALSYAVYAIARTCLVGGRVLTALCRREPSGALGTPRGANFVPPPELDQLVAARLIGRDDSLGAQVLQHPLVGIVGGADLGNRRQRPLERRHRHGLVSHRLRRRQESEPEDALGTRPRRERH